MSNLKDLFISQSFYGIVNLENSTQPITSQSGDVELQDGIGTNLGLRTNADNQKFTVVNNFQVDGNAEFNGNIDVSGSWIHTGSIDVLGNVTVEGNVSANIATFDTVNTRLLHVTEESASVIFSSGSNVIGDDITDVQTIVGQTTISGSLGITGNQINTGNLNISGEISSSTVNGIGNVTTYSASVDSRLDALEGPFSTSVDSRLDSLESFETGQVARNSVLGTYTSSVDSSLASINSFTSSTESSLNSLNSFSSSTDSSLTSINSFTQSADTRITNLENFSSSLDANFVSEAEFDVYTSSVEVEQTQQNNRLTSLEGFTGSLSFDFVETSKFNTYTSSTNNRLDSLETKSGSVDTSITSLNAFTASQLTINSGYNTFTSSYYIDSASFDNRLDNIELTTASLQTEVDGLSSKTGSYATTGSNTFIGDQVFSGSVQGDVHTITVASSTASIDCSQGNFFTLEQASAIDTHLVATNITGGRTITLRVNKTNPSATVSIDGTSIKFPSGFNYTITTGDNIQDIVTFVSFDTGSLYAVASKNFV
jgi:hypothetical protein